MALLVDRDPARCQARIEKRRELLKQAYEENKIELTHPALVEENKPIEAKCNHINCIIKDKEITEKERRTQLIIKSVAITTSVLVIILGILVAWLIGRI